MMRNTSIYFFAFFLVFFAVNVVTAKDQPDEGQLRFIENKGQWNAPIQFKADLPSGSFFLTDQGFVYNFAASGDSVNTLNDSGNVLSAKPQHYHAYKVLFEGAHKNIRYTALDKEQYYHNYFLGNDRSKWSGGVPVYRKIVQQGVYPGIDVAIYSQAAELKYDFIVAPGADPRQIVLSFEGVAPEVTTDGSLKILTSVNTIVEKAPYTYQVIHGNEVEVPSRYRMQKGRLTYDFPRGYDPRFPLIIDPTLVFATYSGALSGSYSAYSSTYDLKGNMIVGALGKNIGWPITTGGYETDTLYENPITVHKYDSSGSTLLYSTFIGGRSPWSLSIPHVMKVNALNELVIAGVTNAFDHAVTPDAFDASYNRTNSSEKAGVGSDLFVTHFSEDGKRLLGSTFVGGELFDGYLMDISDPKYIYSEKIIPTGNATTSPCDIAFDEQHNIWVVSNTECTDFPVTANAQQTKLKGGVDGVLFQLNASCSQLLYSSYLGGSQDDALYGIQKNARGQLVICGGTRSADLPTSPDALYAKAPGGGLDGYVAVVETQSGALLKASYLGTDKVDNATKVQISKDGHIYVLGRTLGNYPISAQAWSVPGADVYIDKLTSDLSTSLKSTRVGRLQNLSVYPVQYFLPTAFLVDACENVYLSGYQSYFSAPSRLPVTSNAFDTFPRRIWMGKISTDFQYLIFGTYWGSEGGETVRSGTAQFAPDGKLYHSFTTNYSPYYPGSINAYMPAKRNNSFNDALSCKFDFGPFLVQSSFELGDGEKDSICAPFTMDFRNYSGFAKEYLWDFGDGTPISRETHPSHTFKEPGIYNVRLYAYNDAACNMVDTYNRKIVVLEIVKPDISVNDTGLCAYTEKVELKVDVLNPGANQQFIWQGEGILQGGNTSHVQVDPRINTQFYIRVTDTIMGICGISSNDSIQVNYKPRSLMLFNGDSLVCKGNTVSVSGIGTPGYQYRWRPALGVKDSTEINTEIQLLREQNYLLTGFYPGCPDTTVELRFTLEEVPQVELGPDKNYCQHSIVALESSVKPYRNDYKYHWSPGTVYEPNAQAPNVSIIADSTLYYSLTVSTPAGCKGTDSILIIVYPGHFGSARSDTGICLPGTLQLQAQGGVRYAWCPAESLDDSTSAEPVAHPSTNTNYTVYIWSEQGCVDSQLVSVSVFPAAVVNLPDSINLYPGERYHLEPGTNCHYFQWFPPSGLSSDRVADPWMAPEVRTRYFLTASTEQGCTVRDSIDVHVICTAIDVPNAFNPNNASEAFKPVLRGMAELIRFAVYNRWGQLLFESKDIDQGWDGYYKGEPQPMGVYVYVLDAKTECGTTLQRKGSLTLIR